MEQLLFSQGALYRLQQLVKAVRTKTGVRHRLSDQKEVFTLLRFGSTSPDTLISGCYAEFIECLDEEQKTYLQGRGLLFYRKEKPHEQHALLHEQRRSAL